MACKADPKRRRKKRIVKRGRELVFNITSLHPPPSCFGFNEAQPQSSSEALLISNARLLNAVFFPLLLSFRTILSMIARRAKNPNVKRTKMEPVRVLSRTDHYPVQQHTVLKCKLLFPDSFKNSVSPPSDSPLSAEKEKGKRSKSSSKEKAESVKPERTSSGGKKVTHRHRL